MCGVDGSDHLAGRNYQTENTMLQSFSRTRLGRPSVWNRKVCFASTPQVGSLLLLNRFRKCGVQPPSLLVG